MGAAAVIGLMATGATLSAAGTYRQSKAVEAAHKFNAQAARNKADSARKVGAEEQFRKRQELRRRLAKNRAATAAAGFTMSGTPLYNQLTTAESYARDIATIGFNYESQAAAYDTEAQLQDAYRKYERDSRALKTASSALGGASQIGQFMYLNSLGKGGGGS